jgi:ribosomal protein L32
VKKDKKTGRLAAPHGLCMSCGVCFGTGRVDVWLRNHSSAYSLDNIGKCK